LALTGRTSRQPLRRMSSNFHLPRLAVVRLHSECVCRHALPPEPWGDRQQVGGSGVLCPQRPQRRSRPTSWDINARSSSLPRLARRHGTDRCGNAAPLVGGNRRRSRSYRHQPTNGRSPEIGNRHHTDCIRGCGLIGLVQRVACHMLVICLS